MSIFGNNVKYLRRLNGFSQKKLAEKCFVGENFISDLESGIETRLSVAYRRVATYFGYDTQYLYTTSVLPDDKCKEIELKLILLKFCIPTTNKYEYWF